MTFSLEDLFNLSREETENKIFKVINQVQMDDDMSFRYV